ncbi:MAG: hypothetical protein ACTHMM_05595 [Agriterribacter sp.]
MKRKRVLFPDELKRFDPKEGADAETSESGAEVAEENGGGDEAGEGDDENGDEY